MFLVIERQLSVCEQRAEGTGEGGAERRWGLVLSWEFDNPYHCWGQSVNEADRSSVMADCNNGSFVGHWRLMLRDNSTSFPPSHILWGLFKSESIKKSFMSLHSYKRVRTEQFCTPNDIKRQGERKCSEWMCKMWCKILGGAIFDETCVEW